MTSKNKKFNKQCKKIAILLPVYGLDNPDYLDSCIKSLINTTYPSDKKNIYIGIDGPICNELENVIYKFKNHIHKIIRSEKNGGLFNILNELIRSLGGEKYIFRMDADDICLPDRFLVQVEFLESNPNLAACGGSLLEFGDDFLHYGVREFPFNSKSCFENLAKGVPIAHPAACFNRSVLRGDLVYPPMRFNEDIALWFDLARKGYEFGNVRECVIEFRLNDVSINRRGREKAVEELSVYVRGSWALYGLNYRLIFPFLRFLFRILPKALRRFFYRRTSIRSKILSL